MRQNIPAAKKPQFLFGTLNFSLFCGHKNGQSPRNRSYINFFHSIKMATHFIQPPRDRSHFIVSVQWWI